MNRVQVKHSCIHIVMIGKPFSSG
ncbi:hypothetical protein [Brevibacillus sp. MER 51]